MNSCILMAEIIKEPQLRYTPDNQTAITEMLVQFPGIRAEDPPTTLKVVGWGNLAQEIQDQYHEGDRIIIEGRLNMNTIERPEGFKEKRAELTASRIHKIGNDTTLEVSTSSATSTSNEVASVGSRKPTASTPQETNSARLVESENSEFKLEKTTPSPKSLTNTKSDRDLDDIPFMQPVNDHSQSENLYDFWEIEANLPGIWLQGNKCLYY
jgi:single-strand DNA-binding protein